MGLPFYSGWITHLPWGARKVLVFGDRRVARRIARRLGWRFLVDRTIPGLRVRDYAVEPR